MGIVEQLHESMAHEGLTKEQGAFLTLSTDYRYAFQRAVESVVMVDAAEQIESMQDDIDEALEDVTYYKNESSDLKRELDGANDTIRDLEKELERLKK